LVVAAAAMLCLASARPAHAMARGGNSMARWDKPANRDSRHAPVNKPHKSTPATPRRDQVNQGADNTSLLLWSLGPATQRQEGTRRAADHTGSNAAPIPPEDSRLLFHSQKRLVESLPSHWGARHLLI